ncbi:hypothetical protein QR680_016208 [Steinernema hermaphroditum]|uniref:TIL domain-containing protein n=1 Tax=Steinernema hermaphroditum TaxID=289476 RepID=A0AA39HAF2_9BILA|nr:hypothetical protein QR680_016208 [Steinernema hermaphroditum]
MKLFCLLALLLSIFVAVALASPLEVLDQKCGRREILGCPHCEPTCEDPMGGLCTRFGCSRTQKCICNDPYVRHNGKCIMESECPKSS